MSRVGKALVAAVLLASAGPASAQTQSTTPTTNTGTRLSFPSSLGGATFERSINYAAPPANNPGQGMAYYYSTPRRLTISVQVYDLGRRVPPGSDNPTVISQFNVEVASAEQQFKHAGYTSFQKPSVPSSCAYGAVTFRCLTYSGLTQANSRVYSKLLLTGFRDHFVKIRVDWMQSHQQTAADADAALQAFVPALMR
ncbi:MAG: hypothetical protein EPO10_14880 [Reyranella sp.]|uniref:hypothetical protein n=1 Tax=Reyranella sp. TaxID=1929291 RepID=UPI0011F41431|nr:hypothetical protein [Reyranella sp.]TAJ92985.1 MAG: hypothetical protein EPO41_12105 [Reyranella sp.]TBR28073.1 MAG: hypothetical protein EPO10_14880 [Reyranella sp.]